MSSTLIVVIAGLLTAFFLFASSIKILGWQRLIFETQLTFFEKYGLNRAIMTGVGFIELFGAIALWLPAPTDLLGSFVLAGTSLGAIYFHLRFDTWRDGVPAGITLILSTTLLVSKVGTLVS